MQIGQHMKREQMGEVSANSWNQLWMILRQPKSMQTLINKRI